MAGRSPCAAARAAIAWKTLGCAGIRFRLFSFSVHGLDHVLELRVHDLALHLERRRELARVLRELALEEPPLLDLLVLRELLVHVLDAPRELLLDLGVLDDG